ncbi:hypothetical protein AcW2_000636 [Taiwanofungus camphoratus]|nr:hypothetical protein AcW2_000636 [Antrodia cinnamomea]
MELVDAEQCTAATLLPKTTPSGGSSRIFRKSLAVTDISIDYLSSADVDLIDPGRDPTPFPQSDPPWSEIVASMPTRDPPFQTVRYGPFEIVPSLTAPHPVCPSDLYQNLLRFISASPPVSLQRVLDYHAAFPDLHSTRSFNLLIKLALRCASFGTAEWLLTKMRAEGIGGDPETRKLRVRYSIRVGKWEECWKEQTAQAQEEGLAMPLVIWLQFFGTAKRGAFRRRFPSGRDLPPHRKDLEAVSPFDPLVLARRYGMLMQNLPSVTEREWVRIPPRVIHQVVSLLIRIKQRQVAIDTTAFYLKHLPQKLNAAWAKLCLDIIHLHMAPGWKRGLKEHYLVKRTLFAFLRLHPSLQPTPTTLFLLLRTVRKTTKCGDLAWSVVQNFVTRWGPEIVDDKVRRRLASIALKQGKMRLVNTIVRAQTHAEEARKELITELDVKNGVPRVRHKRKLGLSDVLRFARRNGEGWRWLLLRRRVWRARSKRKTG